MKKIDKSTLAARATGASGKKFYKSYVKNIRFAEFRNITGHKEWFTEIDFFFSYKGKEYRINEYICPNSNGEVIYSAKYKYELVEL